MKKYAMYLGSFVLSLICLQILYGLFLTAVYTPEVHKAAAIASYNQVSFGNTNYLSFLIAIAAGTIAFAFTRRFAYTEH